MAIAFSPKSGGDMRPWPNGDGREPVQLIVRKLMVDFSNSDLNLSYKWECKPLCETEVPDLQAAALEIFKGTRPPPHADVPEEQPLDFTVSRPSLVLLMVVPADQSKFTVHFDPGTKGLSKGKGENDLGGRYGGLKHIGPGGTLNDDPVENCTAILFRCSPRQPVGKAQVIRAINYHLEFKNSKGMKFNLIIDPEVRNPGNQES